MSEDIATVRYVLKFPPGVGDLLLAGTEPEPWIAWARHTKELFAEMTDADCYLMESNATRVGDWLELDNGLRLRLAADFDPRFFHGDRYRPATGFCVDPAGEVQTVD